MSCARRCPRGWQQTRTGPGKPGCQVYGIPGLRARLTRGQVILARPGLPGRIIIPSPADQAHKAALIAADTHRGEADFRLPWLTHPCDWHPAEERFAGAFPQHYGTGAEPGRASRLASQVLRRLPGLCPAPRAYYHDMWFNRFGDTCRGGLLQDSAYSAVWQAARAAALTPAQHASPLARRPYDLRHAAVSLWLNSGVPATEVARRAGHSVAVLLKVYAHCIDGQADNVNKRIADALGTDHDPGGEDDPAA